jgi:TRAP-type C4-dicarboxylate transport system permease small subunit
MSKRQAFESFIRQWAKWFNWIAMVALVAMFALEIFDIAGGKLFLFPVPGSVDLLGLLLVLTGAFGLAQTEIIRQHIRIDFLVIRLSGRTRVAFDCFGHIMSIILIAMLIWASYLYAIRLFNSGTGSMTLLIPLFPFPFILALTCLPLLLVYVMKLIDTVRGTGKKWA